MNEHLGAVTDLLEEVGSKNHITVIHYHGREADDQVADAVACPPALHLADRLRLLAGKKPMWLPEAYKRLGGDLVGVFPNLRTTVGIDYAAIQLGGTTASTTVAHWIALSNNTNAANAANTATNTGTTQICWGTDTTSDAAASTSRGEYSATSGSGGGMQRNSATYAHTNGVASYSETSTFTATGACTSMQAAGLFNNATKQSGTLFVESIFTPTTLANTDQLSIAWTINI